MLLVSDILTSSILFLLLSMLFSGCCMSPERRAYEAHEKSVEKDRLHKRALFQQTKDGLDADSTYALLNKAYELYRFNLPEDEDLAFNDSVELLARPFFEKWKQRSDLTCAASAAQGPVADELRAIYLALYKPGECSDRNAQFSLYFAEQVDVVYKVIPAGGFEELEAYVKKIDCHYEKCPVASNLCVVADSLNLNRLLMTETDKYALDVFMELESPWSYESNLLKKKFLGNIIPVSDLTPNGVPMYGNEGLLKVTGIYVNENRDLALVEGYSITMDRFYLRKENGSWCVVKNEIIGWF